MDNPEKLRESYIEHLDCLTINWDVNSLDLKSPEYIKLEGELEEKNNQIESYEEKIDEINRKYDDLEKLILKNISDERLSRIDKLL